MQHLWEVDVYKDIGRGNILKETYGPYHKESYAKARVTRERREYYRDEVVGVVFRKSPVVWETDRILGEIPPKDFDELNAEASAPIPYTPL